jgi:hypothetical protein
MKYAVLFLSALIIEICSTFYIRSVSEANTAGMLFFSFIAPFLGLPFISYIVESKDGLERIKMALATGIGYMTGAIIVINLIQ